MTYRLDRLSPVAGLQVGQGGRGISALPKHVAGGTHRGRVVELLVPAHLANATDVLTFCTDRSRIEFQDRPVQYCWRASWQLLKTRVAARSWRRLGPSGVLTVMSAEHTSTIFVIGGTGAQGMPIVRDLVADGKYSVRVLTRDANSARAKALLALGGVTIVEGSFADDDVLREGFRGCDGAFVNIDGFDTGEKTEMYWAIRSYEIALERASSSSSTETSTTHSRSRAMTPGSAPGTMTAKAVWPNGSCPRINPTGTGSIRPYGLCRHSARSEPGVIARLLECVVEVSVDELRCPLRGRSRSCG